MERVWLNERLTDGPGMGKVQLTFAAVSRSSSMATFIWTIAAVARPGAGLIPWCRALRPSFVPRRQVAASRYQNRAGAHPGRGAARAILAGMQRAPDE